MIICGIDPGFGGALGFIHEIGSGMYNVFAYDMPILKVKKPELNLQVLITYIKICDYVFLERAQSMPGQGLSSTFRYAAGYGMIQGICATLEKPITLVHPQTWRRAIMADMPREKEASIQRCMQLYPHLDLRRKKDHGRAESLLIATFGMRQMASR